MMHAPGTNGNGWKRIAQYAALIGIGIVLVRGYTMLIAIDTERRIASEANTAAIQRVEHKLDSLITEYRRFQIQMDRILTEHDRLLRPRRDPP